jgi:hypothetical protein
VARIYLRRIRTQTCGGWFEAYRRRRHGRHAKVASSIGLKKGSRKPDRHIETPVRPRLKSYRCSGITWTLVGSYSKLSTETASGTGLHLSLQFISETPVLLTNRTFQGRKTSDLARQRCHEPKSVVLPGRPRNQISGARTPRSFVFPNN